MQKCTSYVPAGRDRRVALTQHLPMLVWPHPFLLITLVFCFEYLDIYLKISIDIILLFLEV